MARRCAITTRVMATLPGRWQRGLCNPDSPDPVTRRRSRTGSCSLTISTARKRLQALVMIGRCRVVTSNCIRADAMCIQRSMRYSTLFGTRFSVPYSVAAIVWHGRTDLEIFGVDSFTNESIMELATRVHVSEEPAFTAEFHAKQKVELTIWLKNGKTLSGRCEITKGESANPHSAEDIKKKFYQLARPVWGEPLARTVHELCMQ